MTDVCSVLSLWHTGTELVPNSKVRRFGILNVLYLGKLSLCELRSLYSALLCEFLSLMNKENNSVFETLENRLCLICCKPEYV